MNLEKMGDGVGGGGGGDLIKRLLSCIIEILVSCVASLVYVEHVRISGRLLYVDHSFTEQS